MAVNFKEGTRHSIIFIQIKEYGFQYRINSGNDLDLVAKIVNSDNHA